jgi:hypothetical protein
VHEPEDVAAGQLALLVTERRLQRLGRVTDVPVRVQQRDDVARVLDQFAEPVLAARPRGLRAGGVLQGVTQRQRTAHRGAEPLEAVLHDVVGGPHLDVFRRRLLVQRAGDDDHRGIGRLGTYHAERVEGGELRQRVVREDDVRHERAQRVAESRFVLHAPTGEHEPGAPQLAGHELGVRHGVLHDENPRRCSGTARHAST